MGWLINRSGICAASAFFYHDLCNRLADAIRKLADNPVNFDKVNGTHPLILFQVLKTIPERLTVI